MARVLTTLPGIANFQSYGVYCVRNTINNKCYIGSTNRLDERWAEHQGALNKGKYLNEKAHLQYAWNKYGGEVFVFEVLEHCSEDDRLIREQWWLDLLTPYDSRGYNTNKLADRPPSFKGKKHTEEARDKIRQSAVGNQRCKGRKHSEETKRKMSGSMVGKPHPKEVCRNNASKDWLITSPDGSAYKVRNLKDFCRNNGLTYSSMNYVASGEWEQYKGWKCRRLVELCVS